MIKYLYMAGVILWLGFAPEVKAQNREALPKAIEEHFTLSYPYASGIKYRKKDDQVYIDFVMKNEHYHAVYEKEVWRHTTMAYSFERLPQAVKNALQAEKENKQAGEVMLVYLPSGLEEYRIAVTGTNGKTGFLYFSGSGRRLRYQSVKE